MEGEEGEFAGNGGEALNLDEDFNDSEEGSMDKNDPAAVAGGVPKVAPGPGGKVEGEKLDNQPYDLAVDVNDSEEIESDEEEDEVNAMDHGRSPSEQAQK